jgi:hypothetical protein
VGNDPVNKTDPTGMIEHIIVQGQRTRNCGCLTGAQARQFVETLQNAGKYSTLTSTIFQLGIAYNEAKSENKGENKKKKKPKSKTSGKEGAKDVPSWAKGERPFEDENGEEFADRLLDDKYGKGNYSKGPKSEHSKIKKWGNRNFE